MAPTFSPSKTWSIVKGVGIHHKKKGVTGFDGDQEVSGACRALGVSLNLREKTIIDNDQLALAA